MERSKNHVTERAFQSHAGNTLAGRHPKFHGVMMINRYKFMPALFHTVTRLATHSSKTVNPVGSFVSIAPIKFCYTCRSSDVLVVLPTIEIFSHDEKNLPGNSTVG